MLLLLAEDHVGFGDSDKLCLVLTPFQAKERPPTDHRVTSGLPSHKFSQPQPQSTSSTRKDVANFLSLPAELRLQIYEHALTLPYRLGIGGHYFPSPLPPKARPPPSYSFNAEAKAAAIQPTLLNLSHQLREESLPLFYRLSHFVLDVQYARARREVDWWISNALATNEVIAASVRSVTIKHRFGMMNFHGTIDLDLRHLKLVGPAAGCSFLPPSYLSDVYQILGRARIELEKGARRSQVVVGSLRSLIEILGA